MQRDDIIISICRELETGGRIAALFLSGSLGRGTADRFSDIDLLAVAPLEAHETIATEYQASLAGLLPIVFWRQRAAESVLVNVVTEDWQRIDFLLTAPDRLPDYARDTVKPLFDRQHLLDIMRPTSRASRPNRARVEFLINEFIRVLGLLAVVVGRREFETGVAGAGLLRTHCT
jgi:predicted nucleotidyltransferase